MGNISHFFTSDSFFEAFLFEAILKGRSKTSLGSFGRGKTSLSPAPHKKILKFNPCLIRGSDSMGFLNVKTPKPHTKTKHQIDSNKKDVMRLVGIFVGGSFGDPKRCHLR